MSSSPYGEPRHPSSRFLPPEPGVEPPHRLTQGLALRVGLIGALAIVLFIVLFARLWSLQVLSGDRYLAVARDNQVRTYRIEAPRGPILDRKGRVVVENVPGTEVKLWVGDLPEKDRFRVVRRLAAVLDLPAVELARRVDKQAGDRLTPLTVTTTVDEAQVSYLLEHSDEFPGVRVQHTYLRSYPFGTLAAHMLGNVGEIDAAELAAHKGDPLYQLGDKIGKAGVEALMDGDLRGRSGRAQLTVDSLGRQKGEFVVRADAAARYGIRLTLDIELQRAAERALRYGIDVAIENKSYWANGGAIIALDPADGAILALASNPTYKPSVFVPPIDRQKLSRLVDTKSATAHNLPAFNRALAGTYPPGSIFKPVTALAAMQEHMLFPGEQLPCTPFAEYGLDRQRFRNWDPTVNRPMALAEALATSCDTYFYELGNRFYTRGKAGWARMQEWARIFGFGAPTKVDIGGEASGLVPTPAWKRRQFQSDWDRAWNPGDNIQLAIGQKDVTVTPLQMARFYSFLATGRLVEPYLVSETIASAGSGQQGQVVRVHRPSAPRDGIVDPAALQVIQDGLYRATHFEYGTSSGVFANYPIAISGKTGTAEKVVPLPGYPADHLEDQSWWCGWGPSDNARLVVCAIIENGGHGSTAAAPAALKVFEQFFKVKAPATTLRATD